MLLLQSHRDVSGTRDESTAFGQRFKPDRCCCCFCCCGFTSRRLSVEPFGSHRQLQSDYQGRPTTTDYAGCLQTRSLHDKCDCVYKRCRANEKKTKRKRTMTMRRRRRTRRGGRGGPSLSRRLQAYYLLRCEIKRTRDGSTNDQTDILAETQHDRCDGAFNYSQSVSQSASQC